MAHTVLSVQSQLAYGYVGNNVATLAIQLHSLDLIALPTVILSSHVGNKEYYGSVMDPHLFRDLLKGLRSMDIMEDCKHLVSGYFGSIEIIEILQSFIKELKEKDPKRIYVCDPVMGEANKGLFVSSVLAEQIIKQLIPLSDIITPNHFELEYILQTKIRTIQQLKETISNHPLLKDKIVVVTSTYLEDTPMGSMEIIIQQADEVVRTITKKIGSKVVGTGDLFAAVVTSQLALGNKITQAVELAVNYMSNVLTYVNEKGYPELNAASLIKFIHQLKYE